MYSDLDRTNSVGERLRALPSALDPPYDWEQFQTRAEKIRAGAHHAWRYAAVAAGLAAMVAALAMWSRVDSNGPQPDLAADFPSELPALPVSAPQTIRQAEMSEQWLARLPAEPAVMRLGTRSAVADLEDRIALVDDVLSEEGLYEMPPQHVVALRHERARLVNSLAQVRYAETLAAEAP